MRKTQSSSIGWLRLLRSLNCHGSFDTERHRKTPCAWCLCQARSNSFDKKTPCVLCLKDTLFHQSASSSWTQTQDTERTRVLLCVRKTPCFLCVRQVRGHRHKTQKETEYISVLERHRLVFCARKIQSDSLCLVCVKRDLSNADVLVCCLCHKTQSLCEKDTE